MFSLPRGPQRIVCLTEEPTEILYLLGEDQRVVGISAYTVRPPEAKKEKPVVSAFIGGSVRKICDLKPDLIIGFSDIQAELAKQLIAENQQVLIFNQRSLSEIFDVIVNIGALVNQREKASHLVNTYIKRLEQVANSNSVSTVRPKVYFEEWDEPMICGIQWVSQLIDIAGGQDIFQQRAKGKHAKSRYVTVKEVAEKNPDVILASWCGKPFDFDSTKDRFSQHKISAIQHKRVYEIPAEIILQPGPACLKDGLDSLVSIFRSCNKSFE